VVSIDEIKIKLGFAPKIRPKQSTMIPSPMNLNKGRSVYIGATKRPSLPFQSSAQEELKDINNQSSSLSEATEETIENKNDIEGIEEESDPQNLSLNEEEEEKETELFNTFPKLKQTNTDSDSVLRYGEKERSVTVKRKSSILNMLEKRRFSFTVKSDK